MVEPLTAIAVAGIALASYAIGSFPSGVLVARASGVDIRAVGSGNIGATNVARNLGRRRGAIVLLLDALKGAAPVGGLLLLGADARLSPWTIPAAGLAAILGHCASPWLRFRGGKGVATSLGVFAVIAPEITAIAIAAWLVLYLAFRIASIGSIAAAIGFPVAVWFLGEPTPVLVTALGAAAIVVAKHHGNIRRLLNREELKV
jgi:glycerol-3-phosphate acyltransferase PlsY